MKRMKIVDRNRFNRGIVFLLIGIFIIFFIFLTPSYSNTEIKYKTKCVSRGDTLWKIAQEELENNGYFKDEDVRKVVYEIKKINQLEDNDLLEGIEIKIPIY